MKYRVLWIMGWVIFLVGIELRAQGLPVWPPLRVPAKAQALEISAEIEILGKPMQAKVWDVPLSFEETLSEILPSIPKGSFVQEVPMGLNFSGVHQHSMWVLQMHAIDVRQTQILVSASLLADIETDTNPLFPQWVPRSAQWLHASRMARGKEQEYAWIAVVPQRHVPTLMQTLTSSLQLRKWQMMATEPIQWWQRSTANVRFYANLAEDKQNILLWIFCTEEIRTNFCSQSY